MVSDREGVVSGGGSVVVSGGRDVVISGGGSGDVVLSCRKGVVMMACCRQVTLSP